VTDTDEPTPLQRAWPVGATVLATNSHAGTVKIAAALRGGGTKERWVRPERLRREDAQ
jgi:hypothetical protein